MLLTPSPDAQPTSPAPDDIVARWRGLAVALAAGVPHPAPPDLPDAELRRTPAAATIGALAARDGLRPFHFERRSHLPLPDAWTDGSDPEQGAAPTWEDGVLPERKYQSFRHDLALASHHPHHRGKWAAHELCHGLVGFAWRPDATDLFHATAGRLAELLPVALWYGFDEAFLVRCPLHTGSGALFGAPCAACEAVAAADPHDPDAAAMIAWGLGYIDRELAAIARTRRTGVIHPHRVATLDLSSDGIAYAAAHRARLSSPAFAAYIERFTVPGGGVSPDLDALEARVVAVRDALLGRAPLAPLAPSAAHGTARWVAQDLAWRVLTVQTLHGDPLGLDPVLDALAAVVAASIDPAADPQAALTVAVDTLAVRCADPRAPAEVVALPDTGYPLPGLPPATASLDAGLRSALPLTTAAAGPGWHALVARFAADDGPARAPLATRFSAWLDATAPGPVADLVRWEAAVVTLPPAAITLSGPPRDARRRLAPGWRVLRFDHDVLALAEAVEAGQLDVDGLDLTAHDLDLPDPVPTALLLGRDGVDGIALLDVDPCTADALADLGDGAVPDLPADELAALEDHGALVPAALALHHPAARDAVCSTDPGAPR